MPTLGVGRTHRDVGRYKPYLKQETRAAKLVLRKSPFIDSLESFSDKAPRGMIAHDRIRLIAFPNFFHSMDVLFHRPLF